MQHCNHLKKFTTMEDFSELFEFYYRNLKTTNLDILNTKCKLFNKIFEDNSMKQCDLKF